MLDYALRLLSYWSAVRKKVVFFLNSVLQQDVCGERKMYFSSFLAFLLSHTLRFHPHSRPFRSIHRSRMPS